MESITFYLSKSGQNLGGAADTETKTRLQAIPTIVHPLQVLKMDNGGGKGALAQSPQRWFGAMMLGELWSCIDWSAWWAEAAVSVVRQGSEHCASKEYYPFNMIAEAAKYSAGPVWTCNASKGQQEGEKSSSRKASYSAYSSASTKTRSASAYSSSSVPALAKASVCTASSLSAPTAAILDHVDQGCSLCWYAVVIDCDTAAESTCSRSPRLAMPPTSPSVAFFASWNNFAFSCRCGVLQSVELSKYNPGFATLISKSRPFQKE